MKKEAYIEPVPAATVILVREHAGGLQVYLLRRSTQSGFMGGYYVFPGGMVDSEDRDADFWRSHVDLTGFAEAGDHDLDTELSFSFGVAAIRETFEEAGVLLVGGSEKQLAIRAASGMRAAGQLEPGWLRQAAGAHCWRLAFSKLRPWSHWITPELMERRFDTRFFIAEMPEDQKCQPDNLEMTDGIWVAPLEGLAGNLSGRLPLSPPAVVTLQSLSVYTGYEKLKEAVAGRGWEEAIVPQLVLLEKGVLILEPWDPYYGDQNIVIDWKKLSNCVLDPGQPFSRLWNDKGLWKPVR
jgi:8-oxo-dGTP pyrophosphatase MutT (NUDIX family)